MYKMTNYNWIISALDCKVKQGTLENIVYVVHWRLNAFNENHTAETYGCTSMPDPNSTDFTDYENLSKEQIVSWLESVLGVVPEPIEEVEQESQLEKIKASLNTDLILQDNPVKVS